MKWKFFFSTRRTSNKHFQKDIFDEKWLDIELFRACGVEINSNLLLIEALIQKGANTNYVKPGYVVSPLWNAAKYGHIKIMQLLIDNGANVNARGHHGYTVLMIACQFGKVEAVEMLLKQGAKVDSKNDNNMTVLKIACANFHPIIALTIIQHSDRVNQNSTRFQNAPLLAACNTGLYKTVKKLLQNGAEVDETNQDKITPLWLACQLGLTDLVDLLLSHGANVHHKCKLFHSTPLLIACKHGQYNIVEQLLQNGARVNQTCKYDETPLSIAAAEGHTRVMVLLLHYGADINHPDINGNTPLIIACNFDRVNTIALLLQREECNIFHLNDNCETALSISRNKDFYSASLSRVFTYAKFKKRKGENVQTKLIEQKTTRSRIRG